MPLAVSAFLLSQLLGTAVSAYGEYYPRDVATQADLYLRDLNDELWIRDAIADASADAEANLNVGADELWTRDADAEAEADPFADPDADAHVYGDASDSGFWIRDAEANADDMAELDVRDIIDTYGLNAREVVDAYKRDVADLYERAIGEVYGRDSVGTYHSGHLAARSPVQGDEGPKTPSNSPSLNPGLLTAVSRKGSSLGPAQAQANLGASPGTGVNQAKDEKNGDQGDGNISRTSSPRGHGGSSSRQGTIKNPGDLSGPLSSNQPEGSPGGAGGGGKGNEGNILGEQGTPPGPSKDAAKAQQPENQGALGGLGPSPKDAQQPQSPQDSSSPRGGAGSVASRPSGPGIVGGSTGPGSKIGSPPPMSESQPNPEGIGLPRPGSSQEQPGNQKKSKRNHKNRRHLQLSPIDLYARDLEGLSFDRTLTARSPNRSGGKLPFSNQGKSSSQDVGTSQYPGWHSAPSGSNNPTNYPPGTDPLEMSHNSVGIPSSNSPNSNQPSSNIYKNKSSPPSKKKQRRHLQSELDGIQVRDIDDVYYKHGLLARENHKIYNNPQPSAPSPPGPPRAGTGSYSPLSIPSSQQLHRQNAMKDAEMSASLQGLDTGGSAQPPPKFVKSTSRHHRRQVQPTLDEVYARDLLNSYDENNFATRDAGGQSDPFTNPPSSPKSKGTSQSQPNQVKNDPLASGKDYGESQRRFDRQKKIMQQIRSEINMDPGKGQVQGQSGMASDGREITNDKSKEQAGTGSRKQRRSHIENNVKLNHVDNHGGQTLNLGHTTVMNRRGIFKNDIKLNHVDNQGQTLNLGHTNVISGGSDTVGANGASNSASGAPGAQKHFGAHKRRSLEPELNEVYRRDFKDFVKNSKDLVNQLKMDHVDNRGQNLNAGQKNVASSSPPTVGANGASNSASGAPGGHIQIGPHKQRRHVDSALHEIYERDSADAYYDHALAARGQKKQADTKGMAKKESEDMRSRRLKDTSGYYGPSLNDPVQSGPA